MPKLLLLLFAAYALVGLAFAAWWVIAGARRTDPVMHDATFTTKLLFVPGAVGLWPWLFAQSMRGSKPPQNAPHHQGESA